MASPILNYLDPAAVLLELEAKSDGDVIRALGERLRQLGHVRESYVGAVLAREATLPTGLPLGGDNNIAVPHTDPEHVIRPALALAVLKAPVTFSNMENPDEKLPVRVVILMALNDKDRQIEMLQKIAETIQSPEALAALRSANTFEDVCAAFG